MRAGPSSLPQGDLTIMRAFPSLALAATAAAMLLAGCHVDTSRNGDKKSVDMSIGGASLKVKTDKTPSSAALGVANYPGANAMTDKKDENADIDMSFGEFRLRVKTGKFSTQDSLDKVKAFYMGELGHYGDVLECKGGHAVGDKQATGLGLTCDDSEAKKHNNHFNFDTSTEGKDNLELKSGSKRHQHIVALGSKDGATQINVVNLDLPGGKDND